MEVRLFVRDDGRCPYEEWLESLGDPSTRARVRRRINRLRAGNLGDVRGLGAGLLELRLDFGPGYRVYLTRRGTTLIILLCGGDKSTQDRDIEIARNLLQVLEDRRHD